MPLSEQEQRLLDEMERHLLHNDADVVSAPRGGRAVSYRNVVYGTVVLLVGLGALVIGVATQLIIVGVVGFVLMLAGVVLALAPARGVTAEPSPRSQGAPTPRGSSSFMDRMNDRWDRRQDDR